MRANLEMNPTTYVTQDLSIDGNVTANRIIATVLQFTGNLEGLDTITLSVAGRVATKLDPGAYLLGNPFDGTTGETWDVRAASTNVADALIARDTSGSFASGTIRVEGNVELVGADRFLGTTELGEGFSVRTENVDRIRILSTGQVGIGSNHSPSPSYALDVEGSVHATENVIGNVVTGHLVTGSNVAADENVTGNTGTFTGLVTAGEMWVQGNLTVDGGTTLVNSTTTTLEDPILTLGIGTSSSDEKDRGIEFRYGTGTDVRTGFFGWDRSENRFVLLKDATLENEIASGTLGNIHASTLEGDLVGDVLGNLVGNVVGDVQGGVTGDVVGNLTGDVTGNVTGDLLGNVTGNLFGNPFVFGTMTVNEDAFFVGSANVQGNVHVQSSLRVSGQTTIESALEARDEVELGSANKRTWIRGNLDVAQEVAVVGNARFESNTRVDGDAHVEGTLDVMGNVHVPTLFGNVVGNAGQFEKLTVSNIQSAELDGRFDAHGRRTKSFYVSADEGDDAYHGRSLARPFRTIRHAVAQANAFVQLQDVPLKATGVVIHVSPGRYEEVLPILVEENVAIVGDSLRNVLLFPAPGSEQTDYFHAKSGTYFTGLRFRHLRFPAACVSFPCATCDVRVTEQAVVPPPGFSDPPVLFSYPGYDTVPPVYVDSPSIVDTTVLRIEVADPGLGYQPGELDPSAFQVLNEDGTEPLVRAIVESVDVDAQGRVTEVALAGAFDSVREKVVVSGGKGYEGSARVDVPPPSDPEGRAAQFRCIMTDDIAEVRVTGLDADGRIDGVQITHPGFGYTERPFVSIPPPATIQPIVLASPYVQNCSNISGPFDLQGNPISALTPLPYDVNNVANMVSDPIQVDPEGSGMGLRIDGACTHPSSPLRSFVTDSFTQISQGGIGFLLLNRAYAQLVSTFGTFCAAHIKALGGSTVNVSNTVTNFGTEGLHSRGYWPVPYTTADIIAPYEETGFQTDAVLGLPTGMWIPGSGYRSSLRFLSDASAFGQGYAFDPSDPIVLTIDPPTRPTTGSVTARFDPGIDGSSDPLDFPDQPDARPVSTVLGPSNFDDGRLRDTLALARDTEDGFTGVGYEIVPTVRISGGSPTVPAELFVGLSGVNPITLEVREEEKAPEFLSVCRIHGNWHTVQGVARVIDATGQPVPRRYVVSLFPVVEFLNETDAIEFFNASYIGTNSHVMEFVGSGITYNALPEYGGIPNPAKEIVEQAPGRVFYTTSDQLGNTKIGKLFQVEQLTGDVTISTDRFNLSGLNAIGPFSRGGVSVGEQLREVSSDAQLRSSTGAVDGNTVPTQSAVKAYVDRRAVTEVTSGTNGRYLRAFEGEFPPFRWDSLDASSIDQGTLDNARLPSTLEVGEVVATSIAGNVLGNVTGNVVGDVIGNLTGDVQGDVTGNLSGNVTGDVTGNVTGNVTGDVVGNLIGNVTGNVTGDVMGNVQGLVTGNLTGDVSGNLVGHVTGNVTGVAESAVRVGQTLTFQFTSGAPEIEFDGSMKKTIEIGKGETAPSANIGSMKYNGINRDTGALYGGTMDPLGDTRLNYDGHFYASEVHGHLVGNLVGDVTGNVTGSAGSAGQVASPLTFQFTSGASNVQFDGSMERTILIGMGEIAPTANVGSMKYNGTTREPGSMYGGNDDPESTVRLNYDGTFHATTLVGNLDASQLVTGTVPGSRLPSVFVSIDGDTVTGDLLFSRSDPGTPETRRIGTVTEDDFHVRTDGVDRIRILNTGQVGIGENYSPDENYQLDVDGSVYASGDVVLFSDARHKTDVETIDDALETVARMRGVRYRWRDDPDARTHVGLIAQEVEPAFPEVVYTNAETGTMSVAYPALIGPLIEAIKELRRRSDALAAENATLRRDVRALRALVETETDRT